MEKINLIQARKLASDFVEEAGIRTFEKHEFKDWYEGICGVLLESEINLDIEVIKGIFAALPDDADDEIFELAIKSYLIENDLLQPYQVEGEEWALFFSKVGEVTWLNNGAMEALHADPALQARLAVHRKVGGELQA